MAPAGPVRTAMIPMKGHSIMPRNQPTGSGRTPPKRRLQAVALALCMALPVPAASLAEPASLQATSRSIDDLRRIVSVAGEPRSVLWAMEPVAPENPDSFPPGPTDHLLRAALTYGSAGEVAALMGDGPTEAADYPTPAWFPKAAGAGRTSEVIRHHRVQGFMDATVMTVPDAPGVVIVERPSS